MEDCQLKKNIHLNLLDNKKDHIKKKCYLHIRDEQNIPLRNSNIKNYLEAINLLIKNNFEIYYFLIKIWNKTKRVQIF